MPYIPFLSWYKFYFSKMFFGRQTNELPLSFGCVTHLYVLCIILQWKALPACIRNLSLHSNQNRMQLNRYIDHTILKPTTLVTDIEQLCGEAKQYDFAAVCVPPPFVKMAKHLLEGSNTKTATVIGFPFGYSAIEAKIAEILLAMVDNADELDMVVNISQVLSGNWDYVRKEIQEVVELAHQAGQKVKVIFENAYLKDEHKIRLCQICGEVNADWVKTSTGYAPSGATMDDLRLMRKHSPPHVQVKAAGGIRDLDALLAVLEIGVSRCGASRTKEMLDQAKRRLKIA